MESETNWVTHSLTQSEIIKPRSDYAENCSLIL